MAKAQEWIQALARAKQAERQAEEARPINFACGDGRGGRIDARVDDDGDCVVRVRSTAGDEASITVEQSRMAEFSTWLSVTFGITPESPK